MCPRTFTFTRRNVMGFLGYCLLVIFFFIAIVVIALAVVIFGLMMVGKVVIFIFMTPLLAGVVIGALLMRVWHERAAWRKARLDALMSDVQTYGAAFARAKDAHDQNRWLERMMDKTHRYHAYCELHRLRAELREGVTDQ